MSTESEEEIVTNPSASNPLVQTQQFKEIFSCFPLVHRKPYERGGKLLLPPWVLDEISFSNVPLPYTFKVTNKTNLRSSHAGVLEFTVEREDQVKIPSWFMKFLDLKKGDQVEIESVSLPPATYCKIEPMTRNAAYISDVKNVLEQNLKYFACITEGDILSIHEINENQVYKMKIVETKPGSAVTVFECDMEVDFDVPSTKKQQKTSTSVKIDIKPQIDPTGFKPFQGQGKRLNESQVKECEETENQAASKEVTKKKSNASGGKKSSVIEKKRKSTISSEDEPPNKKKRLEEDDTANQLPGATDANRKREQKQVKGNFEPFSGKGHLLKED